MRNKTLPISSAYTVKLVYIVYSINFLTNSCRFWVNDDEDGVLAVLPDEVVDEDVVLGSD